MLLVCSVTASTVVINPVLDGRLTRSGVNENLATISTGAGTGFLNTSDAAISMSSTSTSNQYSTSHKYEMIFDGASLASAMGAGAVIDSAYINITGITGGGGTLSTANMGYGLVNVTPSTMFNTQMSDYNKLGQVYYAPIIPYASWTVIGNNSYALNSAGLSNINTSGRFAVGFAITWQINQSGQTWSSSTYRSNDISTLAGTTKPRLVVTYHTAYPIASFTTNVTDGNVSLPVLFNDTSSSTPTEWNWSFGDGTANATTQNTTHTYTTPGVYNATLTATNAFGSTSATTRIGVIDPNGWVDSLATDSSSHYGIQNSAFTWDTTNHVLVSSATDGGAGAMTFYNGSPFLGGIYQLNWTPKAWNAGYHNDYYAEYLIGAQTRATGEFYSSHDPMWAIYMKRSFDEGYNAMVNADRRGVGCAGQGSRAGSHRG